MRDIHGAGIIHRDLSIPGKNVMLKWAGKRLTASIIDFSLAETCAAGQGELARALDTYHFGGVLSYLCYGNAVRASFYEHVHCGSTIRELNSKDYGLLQKLVAQHKQLHPRERPAFASDLLNRCSFQQQHRLDEIMKMTWRPFLQMWEDANETRLPRHTNLSTLESTAFTWRKIIGQLMSMQAEDRSLLRFND